MGKLRFVQPDTVRLPLSHGDWIEVKKRLNVGEEREAFQSVIGEVNPEGWRRPNLRMMGIAEVVAYIVGWSFDDAQGKRVPVTVDAIKQLSQDDFAEIDAAITAHIQAIEAEDQARKNAPAGETVSAAISLSAG